MTIFKTTAGEWVDALRSGDYKQGRGTLKTLLSENVTQHCCLGVLCDILDPNGWEHADYSVSDRWHIHSSALTPAPVNQQLGNLVGGPDIDPLVPRRVHSMNDDGDSFEAIAVRIEAELPRDHVITFDSEWLTQFTHKELTE